MPQPPIHAFFPPLKPLKPAKKTTNKKKGAKKASASKAQFCELFGISPNSFTLRDKSETASCFMSWQAWVWRNGYDKPWALRSYKPAVAKLMLDDPLLDASVKELVKVEEPLAGVWQDLYNLYYTRLRYDMYRVGMTDHRVEVSVDDANNITAKACQDIKALLEKAVKEGLAVYVWEGYLFTYMMRASKLKDKDGNRLGNAEIYQLFKIGAIEVHLLQLHCGPKSKVTARLAECACIRKAKEMLPGAVMNVKDGAHPAGKKSCGTVGMGVTLVNEEMLRAAGYTWQP